MLDDVEDRRIDAVALAAAPYLTRGVELATLLSALVEACTRTLAADRGTLYLVDRAAGTVTSLIADLPPEQSILLNIGQGIAGAVAQTGETVVVGDAPRDPRFDPTFDQRTGYTTKSVLAVPVSGANGGVIGVLQFLNAAKGVFAAADEAEARALATQVGAVLERTSLYPEVKERSSVEGQRQALAFRFNHIVGESEAMKRVYTLVEKASRTDATVLITGESGTGKELIARAIHVNSGRRGAPFVKVDCTTLPEALIENELFGHEKGAFTGADKTMPGKFEVASGGTLFIDEIGELPLKLQGKLLRVLQDREFERVGGTKTVSTDIRVVCATHRDLLRMVQEGSFREDLFYRVRVVPVHMPPLRERGESDLLRLIEHFVDKFGRRHGRPDVRITDAAVRRLKGHAFPGNIRELEHVIESAVVLCDRGVVEPADLPLPERRAVATDGALVVGDPQLPLDVVEKEHVRRVLAAVGGNQSEAARRLGIGRNTLARKLSQEGDPVDD